MRRRRQARPSLVPVAPAVIALVLAASACDDDSGIDSGDMAVAVSDAWARTTPAGAETAAVYMTIRTDHDDALVGASVDASIASGAMLHETTSTDGQLTMEHTATVALPADEDVLFEPGGRHVMLTSLAAPLAEGATFDVTLDFERADDVAVTVEVRDDAP